MTRVARIELYHVRVPLPATFYPSWIPGFPQNENRFDLIRVLTDDGVEGWSAGPAMGRERTGLGEVLGPYLLGEDATDIALVQQRCRELGYLGWRNFWIEPAFWDIKGQLAGKPVCELLGGERCTVRLYASTGEVKSPAARIEEAEARYAEGFRTIKLRVHDFDERRDIAQVVETARALGTRMQIAVDANQAWRVAVIADAPRWDLARARRFADACADVGVAWLEEPLPMDDWDAQAALTAKSRVPIAGGELHTGGFRAPLAYDDVRADEYDGLLVPGGHAPGMRSMLESPGAQRIVAAFFERERPVGAICHGVLLLARSRLPATGRSVLHGRRTTALTRALELSAWQMTRLWLGDYYRTYPGTTVEDEVRSALADPAHFEAGPALPMRDSARRPGRGFTVRDGTYLSARWPGDCHRFAADYLKLLGEHVARARPQPGAPLSAAGPAAGERSHQPTSH